MKYSLRTYNINKDTKIQIFFKKLEGIRNHVSVNANHYEALRRRLDTLLVKDDLFWKQRAKTFWYRDGDLNTRFFHVATTTKRIRIGIGCSVE